MLREGQFVRVGDNLLGIGKVLRVSGNDVEIEYFDSIGPVGRHIETASGAHVKRVLLPNQRRCYWKERSDWRVGRVVWQGEGEYGVRPPDSEIDLRLPETELYVRWNRPIEDPIHVLIAHGNESPYFHRCRHPFISKVTEQRAASFGMHGVISSVVELHEHQIEIARRVLADPRQRYLLADEVGLGKTIEAGLIIRQYLLDHPEGHVVVIAPPLLCRQWASELRQKFLIDDFGHAAIAVLSHDDPESWAGDTQDNFGRYRANSGAGLVVVDEVHHLAALANSGGDGLHRYEILAELTSVVPRLLLLSATPLLNNERTFLSMLHLLDPEVYHLSDIQGFQRRVRDRQALGTAFYTFRPEVPGFLLIEKMAALRAMFPEDSQMDALLNAVSEALGNADEPLLLQQTVTAARVHISEAYRLHRRLLRTRRDKNLLSTFPVRGRSRPEVIVFPAPPATDIQEWLEDWREYVRSKVDDQRDRKPHAVGALVALAERAGSHPLLLAAAAQYRMEGGANSAQLAELSSGEQNALRAWDVDAVERGILTRALDFETTGEAGGAVIEFLKGSHSKTVLFASFTTTAQHIQDVLVEEFGSSAVASHLSNDDPAAVEAELDRFRETDSGCWILVCDRSAEEGRNLQFAEQAIHFDLPLSANRLEQRIGRLDRFGHGDVIPTYVIENGLGTIADAWDLCLLNGFQVFDRSIASLQFAIEVLLPEVHEVFLDHGVTGLARITKQLPDRLASEQSAIAEQDALDAIEVVDHANTLSTALDDVEDMWFQIQRATEGLLCDEPGNLRFHRVVDPANEHYRSYRFTLPGRAPQINSMPLVAWDVLQTKFRPVIDPVGTYFRRAAIAHADTRLFRVGEPLIDALAEYMRWDDRGQTFVFWRFLRQIAEDSINFRFDFLVEANTDDAAVVLNSSGTDLDFRALQRRADAFLAPSIATIWTSSVGKEINDPAILKLLRAPYDPRLGDLNVNHERQWALQEFVGDDWEALCASARSTSIKSLNGRPNFLAACSAAEERFREVCRLAYAQREFRINKLAPRQRSFEEAELAFDRRVDAALTAGILDPRVRLDSVGAVILTSYVPDGPGFPGTAVDR